MVYSSTVRPKRLLYLIIVSLFGGAFFFLPSWHKNSNDTNSDIIPAVGVSLPDLDQFEFLPGTASPCGSSTPQLLAFVHSSPTNIPHREAIRKTWGSPKYLDIRTVFVVGRSENDKIWKRIQQEAEEHGDLVLPSFVDSYKNLTLKHLSSLKWVVSNCPRVAYVLKADDDTFVDTHRLSSMVHVYLGDGSGSKHSLVCHVIPEGTSPKRSGKWMVTPEEYPYEDYPEYCSGLAYFSRLSTLESVFEVASSGGVPYLRVDDVFVTGLAASLAGVKRQDLGVRFASTELPVVEWLTRKSERPCPWMVAEMSPYYWPRDAFKLWNKTVLAWEKSKQVHLYRNTLSHRSPLEFIS